MRDGERVEDDGSGVIRTARSGAETPYVRDTRVRFPPRVSFAAFLTCMEVARVVMCEGRGAPREDSLA